MAIRFLRTLALGCFSAFVVAGAAAAQQSEMTATPEDRAIVEACLQHVRQAAEKRAQERSDATEAVGPAGRIAAAVREAPFDQASCIGAVSNPCLQQPGGYATHAMSECFNREWAVWDERLNAAYASSLKGAAKPLATTLRGAQRAWLAWRDLRCKLPQIENEGGTIVGPLYADCMQHTTAQQALWLEQR